MSDLSRLILEAGVVGAGGAGFPTHVKYSGGAEIFLVNGAECEPLLKTDQYIMARFADRLCLAALAVKEHLGAARVIFALKEHYHEQIGALKTAAKKIAGNGGIEFCLLDSVYPAGDEQVLLYEAAGLTVPPGGLPLAAGAVVSNAGTLLGVADALEGKPVTHKYLTVAGAVERPSVLHVPIGTGFEECIRLAGGPDRKAAGAGCCVIAGGPVMGRPVSPAEMGAEVVTKTTSGIIVLPEDHYLERRQRLSPVHMKNRARASCIQCSICSDLCPRRLLGSPLRPHLVMRAFGSAPDTDALLETEAARNAMLCCECGICEIYACPMELSPCRINILVKQELRRRGIRPEFPPAGPPCPDRPWRRIPSERMAARAGVLEYYPAEGYGSLSGAGRCGDPGGYLRRDPGKKPLGNPPGQFVEFADCARVSIPLQMHTGAAAVPCVAPGRRVRAGELVADIPGNSLGARVHASIGGLVTGIEGGRIIIEAEGRAP
ncbi:MAG: 4Fe-4S dicluster domain-containing protein [Treponema sp.]|jgi:Na+-translocating ferredoxin:NAD+ oxidoreductase RnfC subunit|nr:4Fe-4S dicluster domain-containing protein [Treponema sp.]